MLNWVRRVSSFEEAMNTRPSPFLRAVRKVFGASLLLGAVGFCYLFFSTWTGDVTFATAVLFALFISAMGITALVFSGLALLPLQYWLHRRAFKEEVRRRGPLSGEEQRTLLERHRIEAFHPETLRDPRVIPWWEW